MSDRTTDPSATADAEPSAPGHSYLEGATCRYCGHHRIRVEMRFVPSELGTYSLAGAQMKFEATQWPFAVCEGCGHESKGTRD